MTTAEMAKAAATEHLAAIGWRPEMGLSDEVLGLGHEAWGTPPGFGAGYPGGLTCGEWSARCAARVRFQARKAAVAGP